MDALHIALLIGGGVLGGMLSVIVGGAAVITYPALIAAGVPPLIASASNLAALTPANLAAALTDYSRLPPLDRGFLGLVFASITGAGVGAMLLLHTPDRAFEIIVPLLLGFSTVMFAYAPKISVWLRERAARQGRAVGFSVTSLKMLLPVSFYGGYFGAGAGVLLLGVLSVATAGDYRSANATKNLVGGFNSLAATGVFIWQGAVRWPQTLVLMAGCVIGGLIGSWLARLVPQRAVRVLVVAVGAVMTLAFVYRYWL